MGRMAIAVTRRFTAACQTEIGSNEQRTSTNIENARPPPGGLCLFPHDEAMPPIVKVCGCRPHEGGAACTGGRRTQTSKGGNRGRCGESARQMLWGFRRRRSVAEGQ